MSRAENEYRDLPKNLRVGYSEKMDSKEMDYNAFDSKFDRLSDSLDGLEKLCEDLKSSLEPILIPPENVPTCETPYDCDAQNFQTSIFEQRISDAIEKVDSLRDGFRRLSVRIDI